MAGKYESKISENELGMAIITTKYTKDNTNSNCPKCGNEYIGFEGECAACKFAGIGSAFSVFVETLVPAINKITDVFNSMGFLNIPTEKELARQRSRDDLKSKRKSNRRGGLNYRKQ